ncbi:MAG TPA: TIGR03084 family metal-binding protein [Streptosporangiaceae bacterium]|nr:TIGR03084 family metal-binding protein [Streptosporangiaceae bacterium]
MAADLAGLLGDLAAETVVLDGLLAGLGAARWPTPTPSPGWSVHDQVTHLAYFDETAALAAADPGRFRAEAATLGAGFPDEIARRYRAMPPAGALGWFRTARAGYLATFRGLDPRQRLPWYGPGMSAASSVTARLMETWAHGQDVADTLGVTRPPSARLRHVAHLGVSTFRFTFLLNARAVPDAPVRVELTAPGDGRWAWGPADAANRVTGPALDFCLAVTQRRHLDDLALEITGPVAAAWMPIAQAFAGPPGHGRKPGMAVPGGTQ